MDATVRRSSRRVHTLITLTVLACVSFLALISRGSGAHSIVLHDRREIFVRQGGFISSTTVPTTETDSIGPSTTSSASSTSSQSSATTISNVTSSTGSSTSVPSSSTTRSSTTSSQSSIESTTHLSTSSTSTTKLPPSITSTTSRTTLSLIPLTTVPPLSEIFDPQPATTIDLATNALQTSTIATTMAIPQPPSDASSMLPASNASSSVSAAAKSSGFWQNKGAVAATFVIVSLVLLGIAAVVVINYMKRRSVRRHNLIHEELFEKFSDSGHRSNSPGPSINAAPMDAFPSRDVVYANPFENYGGVEHQRVAPSAVPAARKTTAPTAFRNPVGRTPVARESYQQSIDSFYGGIASQPSSSGYAM
ncbi:hypothetical protein BJ912DRAFT_939353 [Pholiota molesta]|nr:hypothetical protein BJ912DRAFT_939353 [Pholiota molesta]